MKKVSKIGNFLRWNYPEKSLTVLGHIKAVFVYLCLCICICVFVFVYWYLRICICAFVFVYLDLCICIWICVFVFSYLKPARDESKKAFAEKWAATCDCWPKTSMLLSYATDHPFKRQELAFYNTLACHQDYFHMLPIARNCIVQYKLKWVIKLHILLTTAFQESFHNMPPYTLNLTSNYILQYMLKCGIEFHICYWPVPGKKLQFYNWPPLQTTQVPMHHNPRGCWTIVRARPLRIHSKS